MRSRTCWAAFLDEYDAVDLSTGDAAMASSERQRMAHRRSADERARALAPIVRELRAVGFVKLQDMADELNKREIASAYGGRWHPSTVLRLLARLKRGREPMA
jgi:hypothetical protein